MTLKQMQIVYAPRFWKRFSDAVLPGMTTIQSIGFMMLVIPIGALILTVLFMLASMNWYLTAGALWFIVGFLMFAWRSR
jgi:hypothetical protein